MTKWDRRDWAIVAALTLLAAVLRFYKLGEVPPGFQFDEAFNAIDAEQVLQGNRPLFLPANAGREVLYTYWQALLVGIFGMSVYTLRLASTLIGIVTVPVTYAFLRLLLYRNSRRVAAFTSLALTISLWHLHFSRYGIRAITMPLILCGAFGLFSLGQTAATRGRRLAAYCGSGLLVGLTVWTHPTGRLVPFVLILYTLWLLWRMPPASGWRARFALDGPFGGLVLTGCVAFLTFLPLGVEFYNNPDFFLGHASEVSVFAQRVSGGTPLRMLGENTLRALGMFTFYGDRAWIHNVAGRPAFDLLLSITFAIGFVLWMIRLWRHSDNDPDCDALALLAAWTFVLLFPSILSEDTPNFSRTLASLPAAFIPVGLGMTWISLRRRPWPWLGTLLATGILLVGTGSTIYAYFVRFVQSEAVYYHYDADKLDALNYLAELTNTNEVYLSQLWGDKHATVFFLRGNLGIKSLDTSDTIVLPPPGRGAVYAFPSEQEERAHQFAELWPDAVHDVVRDPYDRPMLNIVRIDAAAASSWPEEYQPTQFHTARFDEAPTLVGMEADDKHGRLLLFWLAEQVMLRNLTSYVHLIDADGHLVGQVDKLPGSGSYLTSVWMPGERLVERYYPNILDRCAGGDEVRVQVGWYEYAAENARRPRTDAPGDTALAGMMTVPHRSYPPDELQPVPHLSIDLDQELTLLGYDLRGADLQAGSPVTLDLYWHGKHNDDDEAPANRTIALQIVKDDSSYTLWQGQIAPQADWDPGEAICRRLRFRLPVDAESGSYGLQLVSEPSTQGREEQIVSMGDLKLGPSTRHFVAPDVAAPVSATLGEAGASDGVVRLLGISSLIQEDAELSASNTLTATLVWQAVTPPESSYKAFVHLIDNEGHIVAQSDAIPGSAYPTNRWVVGEVVLDTHVLQLPQGIEAGSYQLMAGLYDPVSNQRTPAFDRDDVRLHGDAVHVGTVALPLSTP